MFRFNCRENRFHKRQGSRCDTEVQNIHIKAFLTRISTRSFSLTFKYVRENQNAQQLKLEGDATWTIKFFNSNDSQIGNKQNVKLPIVQYFPALMISLFMLCFSARGCEMKVNLFVAAWTPRKEWKEKKCVYQLHSIMGCFIVHSSKVFWKLWVAEGRFNINNKSNVAL